MPPPVSTPTGQYFKEEPSSRQDRPEPKLGDDGDGQDWHTRDAEWLMASNHATAGLFFRKLFRPRPINLEPMTSQELSGPAEMSAAKMTSR